MAIVANIEAPLTCHLQLTRQFLEMIIQPIEGPHACVTLARNLPALDSFVTLDITVR